jgi:hypothetical protein
MRASLLSLVVGIVVLLGTFVALDFDCLDRSYRLDPQEEVLHQRFLLAHERLRQAEAHGRPAEVLDRLASEANETAVEWQLYLKEKRR